MDKNEIPLLDCPVDYLMGDASGKVMNEYGRFPCKIQCGVFSLLVRGRATATINIKRYEFKTNDMMLLEPSSFLLIHEFSDDALVYYVLFSSSFLEKYTFGNRMSLTALQVYNPIVHLTDEQADWMKDLYQLLLKGSNTTPSMLSTEKMVHVFNILQQTYASIAKSTNDQLIQAVDRKTQIYQEYCQLVLKNYQRWHHVSQYASEMRLTLPHLCATIRSVGERTAGDIIIDAILTDAKAQLKLTNLPIKEISNTLGFDNVAFFNRFFKSHTGQTPKVYRGV